MRTVLMFCLCPGLWGATVTAMLQGPGVVLSEPLMVQILEPGHFVLSVTYNGGPVDGACPARCQGAREDKGILTNALGQEVGYVSFAGLYGFNPDYNQVDPSPNYQIGLNLAAGTYTLRAVARDIIPTQVPFAENVTAMLDGPNQLILTAPEPQFTAALGLMALMGLRRLGLGRRRRLQGHGSDNREPAR